ncbi:MAG: hypothetical protein ACR2P5_05885 [Gammaproteobacteria bacterium]
MPFPRRYYPRKRGRKFRPFREAKIDTAGGKEISAFAGMEISGNGEIIGRNCKGESEDKSEDGGGVFGGGTGNYLPFSANAGGGFSKTAREILRRCPIFRLARP